MSREGSSTVTSFWFTPSLSYILTIAVRVTVGLEKRDRSFTDMRELIADPC